MSDHHDHAPARPASRWIVVGVVFALAFCLAVLGAQLQWASG